MDWEVFDDALSFPLKKNRGVKILESMVSSKMLDIVMDYLWSFRQFYDRNLPMYGTIKYGCNTAPTKRQYAVIYDRKLYGTTVYIIVFSRYSDCNDCLQDCQIPIYKIRSSLQKKQELTRRFLLKTRKKSRRFLSKSGSIFGCLFSKKFGIFVYARDRYFLLIINTG